MNNPELAEINLISKNQHLNSSSSSSGDNLAKESQKQLEEVMPEFNGRNDNILENIQNSQYMKDSSSFNNQRKQRRSKKELVGRDFICKECGKSYLSNSSLYAHTKVQHPNFLQQFREESKISSGV